MNATKNGRETTLAVEGMTCGSCVSHVTRALKELDGVEQVTVELRAGKVRVAHAASTGLESLVAALEEAGYPARPAGGAA